MGSKALDIQTLPKDLFCCCCACIMEDEGYVPLIFSTVKEEINYCILTFNQCALLITFISYRSHTHMSQGRFFFLFTLFSFSVFFFLTEFESQYKPKCYNWMLLETFPKIDFCTNEGMKNMLNWQQSIFVTQPLHLRLRKEVFSSMRILQFVISFC